MKTQLILALTLAILAGSSMSIPAHADYVSYFDSQFGTGSEQFASANNSNALVYSGTSTQIGGCFNKTWASAYEGASGVIVLSNIYCLANDDNESFSLGTSTLTVNDSKIIYFSMRWRANFTNPPTSYALPVLKVQDLTTSRLVYAKNNTGFPVDQWNDISATFNIPVGHSYNVSLDFGEWTEIWNDTAIYVDSINVGTVEMDRADAVEPSDGDKRALCNASLDFGIPVDGMKDGTAFNLLVADLFDNDIPCSVTWHNNLTSVRLPIASIQGYSDSSYVGSWYRNSESDRGQVNVLAFYRDYLLSYDSVYLNYYTCEGGCSYYYPRFDSVDLYYKLNSTYIERLNLYNYSANGWCWGASYSGDLDVRTNPDIHNVDVDRFASGAIVPSVNGGFFLPENWGSQITCSWGGSGGSYHTTLRPVPFPYEPSVHLCTPSWSCDPIAKQESYLSSTCTLTQVHSCGECGCETSGLGGRCNVVSSHWECNSGFENWHYNDLCVSDFALFCDTGCVNDTCDGEVTCYDDTECQSTCDGNTLTPSLGCDLISYSCTYGTPVVCANGCSGGACLGSPSPVQTPLNLTMSDPLGAISMISGGVLGFLSYTANPFLLFVFIIIVVIIVISLFSIVVTIVKKMSK